MNCEGSKSFPYDPSMDTVHSMNLQRHRERKIPPKIEDITRMKAESRLTETRACLTSGVMLFSCLFMVQPESCFVRTASDKFDFD